MTGFDPFAPYRYDPMQRPRMIELRQRRAHGEKLTLEERAELEWLTYSFTNFLLDGLRGKGD